MIFFVIFSIGRLLTAQAVKRLMPYGGGTQNKRHTRTCSAAGTAEDPLYCDWNGGDALTEVAFDTVGKKKLMLKSAGAHMRKL